MAEDWYMVWHIGMGKASACRMILEVVCEMNVVMQVLKGIVGILKALFRLKCTYDPADIEEEQLNRAFAGPFIVTQRSRPNKIMRATWWNAIIQKQGLDFQSAIYARIAKFNADKVEGFVILDHKVCCVKAYSHQSDQFIEILEQHWQNFKPQESAALPTNSRIQISLLTPRRIGTRRPTCCLVTSAHVHISAMYYGFFCRAVKGAQRANNKIGLTNNAIEYSSKANDILHDDICVMVHCLPEFKQHTTEAQCQDLVNRLNKGYLV
jgi:hypothetical protein